MKNRLFRSRSEKIWAGVCGGLANYFDIDPVIVRLLVALSFFISGGITFILYLVCIFIIPKESYYPLNNQWQQGRVPNIPDPEHHEEPIRPSAMSDGQNEINEQPFTEPAPQVENRNTKKTFGIILVIFGGILLLRNVFPFFENVSIFPLMLILIGVWMIASYPKKGFSDETR